MGFIVSLESCDCQNHRIFNQNKLRKAFMPCGSVHELLLQLQPLGGQPQILFLMLVGMVYAVSSHFVDVFYKFLFHLLFVFLRIIFSITTESPASFFDGFILLQKTALVSEKSKKAEFILGRFIPHLQKWRSSFLVGIC